MSMKNDLIALLQKKWVTPIEALNEAHSFSLAQRVSELRRRGVTVIDKWVDLRSGKRIKAYRIPRQLKADGTPR